MRYKRYRKIIPTITAIMLTAAIGRIQFQNHSETWYNLPMQKVTARAKANGINGDYWERADGCKMYGHYIIVAADWNLHPYGTVVETSRGLGLVLDTHTAKDRTLVDMAVTWGKGGAE